MGKSPPRCANEPLDLAERYRDEQQAEPYHRASRALVRQPYLNRAQYHFGLRQAANCLPTGSGKQHLPDNAWHGALPRRAIQRGSGHAGREDQSITPEDLAFLAMAQRRLGNEADARGTMSRLRTMMQMPEWFNHAQARSFVQEAETVLAQP